MCGINGVNRGDAELVRAMNRTIHHRGPDDEGTFTDNGIALGSCRLKVIDLTSAGHQPFSNEEGTRWIVFNGEIYNYRALRSELMALGRPFRSGSDTEVVLAAFETWGIDFLDHLEGMWAFAIYDQGQQELYLARDRMGVKPLYYLAEGMNFAFSSELKTFTVPPLRRPLDPIGLSELVALGFNPVRRTCLKNVWKLRPGELLRYSLRDLQYRVRRYWRRAGPLPTSANGHGEGHGDVHRAVRAAVESSLVSDVPVGSYLSGGIDSSIVTLLYARTYSSRLHSYTVGFEGTQDERPYARYLAELVGAGYHEITLRSDEIEKEFDRIAFAYDLSLTDPAFVPSYYLARRAKQDVTVVLSGEGGDELFGGYDYYRPLHFIRSSGLGGFALWSRGLAAREVGRTRWGDAALKGLNTLGHVNGNAAYAVDLYSALPVDRIVRLLHGYDPSLVVHDLVREAERELIPTEEEEAFLLYDQMFLLAEKFNAKADKASSFFSVEGRVPLQERGVVELANRIPLSRKIGIAQGKLQLRSLLAAEAPALARRPKHGFEPPIGEWLRGPLQARLDGAIERLTALAVLEPHGTDRLVERVVTRSASLNEHRFTWNLLVAGEGLRQYGYGG
ncbi:MAG TPA: asparagine synthase (glutamine-hydrolyzing) [Thermoplasmata archaeon]|nr:asparagine synthase (glutamine-hydrolyzing) [Thermoplasmata archaeon]